MYDEALRSTKAIQFGVHATVVQAVKDDLSHINPYVASLHHFHATPRRQQQVVKLKDYSSNGDFAAVMHAFNSTTINPHSILICQHGSSNPQYINILSHHYEPLYYTLFFPHGEIGWGSSSVAGVPPLSQMDWYRNCVLADDDDWFSTLGRLCCEYLVDMYSWTEEQCLLYILRCRLSKRRQLRTIENSSPDNVPWLPRMVDYKLGNLQNSPRRSNTHKIMGGIELVRKLSLNQ
jgi:hypothetical protein